ncbi:hypothetical protein HK405_007655 [Cladochytrium tenue]|nr:hypothetical protein HK405_007655 [Cladochytrium tenue]
MGSGEDIYIHGRYQPLSQQLQQDDQERALHGTEARNKQLAARTRRPWWKTRRAIAGYVATLVVFVVLLVQGLLGYLWKATPVSTGSVTKQAAPTPTNLPTTNAPGQDPTVDLGYATYVGTSVSGGVNRFLGMRYAAAPVGDLRWRAPTSPPTSTKAQLAKEFGPICLGISVELSSTTQSEDCLFVNVWAPAGAGTTAKLPVWLYIQGGGYDSNANADYDGTEVVRRSGKEVVFVNFNYRVSMWGFLASAKVHANGSLNAGLLDQRFLMQWVKTNIARFGGDPDNVTVHGASAGAGSIALHLVAHGGRNDGLFAAVIAESIFFPPYPFMPQLEFQFSHFVNATGCATADDVMACLRALDTTVLQAQNVKSPFPGRKESPMPLFYWTPCIDGDFLQDLPYNLFARGKFVDVPLLFGNDNDEGSYYAANASTSDDMVTFLQINYPLLTDNDTTAIIALYPKMPAVAQHAAWFPTTSMAYGEAIFVCPALNILSACRVAKGSANTKIWNYRYNVLDDGNAAAGLGVPHLWDQFAVFGPTSLSGLIAPASYLTYDASIVPIVMDFFLSFVQTHDPNPMRSARSPFWEDWGSSGTTNGSRIVFETNNTRMETIEGAQMDRCRFWAGLAPWRQ